MHCFKILPAVVAITFVSVSSLNADAIISAQSVTAYSSFDPASQLIDQSGLSSTFTSGVTDFDAYIASNPTHNSSTNSHFWSSALFNLTGDIDFDLGSLTTIESIAIWNMGNASNVSVRTFNLLGDADGDFSSGAIGLLSNQSADTNTGPSHAVLPEVFSFTSTEVRFVRLQITANNGNPIATRLGEVAFKRSAAIPEPTSLLTFGLACCLGLKRRRRK